MLILYKLAEEIIVPADQTGRLEQNTLKRIYNKYLMKVSSLGLCIAIPNIHYRNNIILRESADVLVEVTVDILCVQFSQGEYLEGTVKEITDKGIKVQFMGVLEGMLRPNTMHPNTRYDAQNNRWLLLQGTGSAYAWRTQTKAFFKIAKVCNGCYDIQNGTMPNIKQAYAISSLCGRMNWALGHNNGGYESNKYNVYHCLKPLVNSNDSISSKA